MYIIAITINKAIVVMRRMSVLDCLHDSLRPTFYGYFKESFRGEYHMRHSFR